MLCLYSIVISLTFLKYWLHPACGGDERGAMKKSAIGWTCIYLVAFCAVAFGQTQELPLRIKVMKEELFRNFEVLQKEKTPPYYMSYAIDEVRAQSVTGSFGAILAKNEDKSAILRISVRTGSYNLDNNHELRRGSSASQLNRTSGAIRAPLGDSPEALKMLLWRETDGIYRNAVETLSRVKSEQSMNVAEEDKSDDFSKIEPHTSLEKPLEIRVDLDKWAGRIRKFTGLFKDYPFIFDCIGSFQSEVRHKFLVDTEGTMVSTPVNYMRLQISGLVKADDGMELPLYQSYFGYKESDFPSEAQIMGDIKSMIAALEKLRASKLVDPYTGPAILSGKASGVFFHEILGHRLEGHRLKSESEGQTFKKKVGTPVLPEFMSVTFDPTIKELNGFALSGAYHFDDEGTKAEKVAAIQNGIMKDFLMSRTPVEYYPHSNGHGRAQPGQKPVSRQSNLIVESKKMLQEDALRLMLIEETKKQNKPFGLMFTEISGGSTITGRSSANSFNVVPLAVYKIYADGRPDEMVRGVNLIGTPLTTFGKIIATGSKMEVFNGTCGAESGAVPVSAVSPSILISEIEVQKISKSPEKVPILPAPPDKMENQNGGKQ
jgi:TldD protein